MSTSTVIAITTAQSSSLAIAARVAKHSACEGVIQTFNAKGSTVDAMRFYADCVDLLYPDPMEISEIQVVKYALIACFIGSGVGVWLGCKESPFDNIAADAIMGFLIGFFGVGFGLSLIGIIFASIIFIIGG